MSTKVQEPKLDIEDPFEGVEYPADSELGIVASARWQALRLAYQNVNSGTFGRREMLAWLRTDGGRAWLVGHIKCETRDEILSDLKAPVVTQHVDVEDMPESDVYRLRARTHAQIDRVSAAVGDLKALKMSRFDPGQLAGAFDAVARAVEAGKGLLVKTLVVAVACLALAGCGSGHGGQAVNDGGNTVSTCAGGQCRAR